MNYAKTAILLAAMTALFLVVGYLLGGLGGGMVEARDQTPWTIAAPRRKRPEASCRAIRSSPVQSGSGLVTTPEVERPIRLTRAWKRSARPGRLSIGLGALDAFLAIIRSILSFFVCADSTAECAGLSRGSLRTKREKPIHSADFRPQIGPGA